MLDFQNARILSLSVENKFFGESARYASTQSLTVEGSIYNLGNLSGVAEVWSGISGMVSSANDYDNILLQGVSFGPGRIESIRLTEGDDVQKKDYQVALTIFNSGNLYNLSSYLTGVDFSHASLIDRFSESYEIQVAENRDWTKQQQVNIRFVSGSPTVNPINLAKALASGLFASQPSFGFISSEFSGLNNHVGYTLYKETYNLISNECSFTQVVGIPSTASGNYSAQFSYQTTTDERGILTIEEHGKIQALVDPFDVVASGAFNQVISGAYVRCVAESSNFLNGGSGISPIQVVLSKRVDIFEGNIEYSIAFSNDPAINSTYVWDYTQEIRRENCVNYISEQGHVKGTSITCTFAERYANALAGYFTVSGSLFARAQAFANSLGVGTIRNIGYGEQKSVFLGEITYHAEYSDALVSTAVGNTIRKVETEVEDQMPVALVNTFIAYGFGGTQGIEFIQPANIPTPGRRTATVKVYANAGVNKSGMISQAQTYLNGSVPSGTDPYIMQAGYSYDATNNILTARAIWSFFQNWGVSNLTA